MKVNNIMRAISRMKRKEWTSFRLYLPAHARNGTRSSFSRVHFNLRSLAHFSLKKSETFQKTSFDPYRQLFHRKFFAAIALNRTAYDRTGNDSIGYDIIG